jgi:alkyl hydroperoxide reductase subunit AhpC
MTFETVKTWDNHMKKKHNNVGIWIINDRNPTIKHFFGVARPISR